MIRALSWGRAWLRLELRRRWRSLAVLALLIAFATATVLAAVAGAGRGYTALDRLMAVSLPAHATALPNDPGFDWARVRALPSVEVVATFAVAPFFVDELPGMYGYLPRADANGMHLIERPAVLEGRLTDPARADEVVVSANLLPTYGKRVGDPLTLRLMTPQEADDPAFDGVPHGPVVKARIVGVVRSPWFTDVSPDEGGQVFPSPALHAAYRPNFEGADRAYGFVNAILRLKQGEAGLPAFRAELAAATGRADIDVWNLADKERHLQKVNAFESVALAAFGLAALVAAMVLIGQALARYTSANVADLQALRACGLTPRQTLLAASIAPFLAAVAGATLGVAGAVALSPWLPIGMAALVEPAPGFDVDVPVMVSGWLAVPLLVLAGALGAGRLALAATRAGAPGRRSALAGLAARAGLPVPVVVGARYAFEPGRGASRVPVRPALLGAVAGVLGVLAAFTFSAGVADAAERPERYGQTAHFGLFLGENGKDWAPADRVLREVARDPDVTAVNDTRTAVTESGDLSVTMHTYRPVGRPLELVLTSGRPPAADDEAVLAVSTARKLGAEPGSVVRLGAHPVRVSGLGFVPQGAHNDYDAGGWLTPEGFTRLFGATYKHHVGLVSVREGADRQAVMARVEQAVRELGGAERVGFGTQAPPVQLAEIKDVRELPLFLGGFLALLALGAVGHALATTVRRRTREMAVMRAIGMTRGQCRLVVVTQATLLALVGLAFGVPLGVAVGRLLWRAVADSTPMFYVPPVALWALALVAPVSLVLVNVLAAWPGRLAARLRVAQTLRAE